MPKNHLLHRLPTAALAFRGYNVVNLGRTPELLAHPRFGATVERRLARSVACTYWLTCCIWLRRQPGSEDSSYSS